MAKPKTEEDQMKEYQTAAKRLDSTKLVCLLLLLLCCENPHIDTLILIHPDFL